MDSKKRLIFMGIWGAIFMVKFGETIPLSFQPLLLAELGISTAVIGLALTANALMIAVSLPIVGRFSD